jgi:NitT/TauT family transport system substrate-binding protein
MLTAAAAAVATAASFPRPARADATLIRFGAGPGDSFGEGYYVRDGGFLKKVGLDATFTDLTNGGGLTAGLAAGALDATVSNVASIAAAHIHGLPVGVIAGSALYSASDPATTAVLVLKGSSIQSAADLRDKIVGLSTLHDLQQAAVMTWLDKSGLPSSAVKFVEVPNTLQLSALKSGRVDAVCSTEPWTTNSMGDARILTKPYDAFGQRLIFTAWMVNKNWAAANPDTVRKLVAAIGETARWANANRPATAAIMAKYSNLSPETIEKMHRLRYAEKLSPELMQPIIDASAHYGFIPNSFPAQEMFFKV